MRPYAGEIDSARAGGPLPDAELCQLLRIVGRLGEQPFAERADLGSIGQRQRADDVVGERRGERRPALPALGGELVFRPGRGIDAKYKPLQVRLRSGGERLQPHPRRPRRTLKNLFQEAGVPSWQRDRLPLLYCGDELVWAAGLGIDARFQGRGVVPQWKERS